MTRRRAWILTLLLAVAARGDTAAPPIKAFCIDFNWGAGGVAGFARPGLWADASPEEHVAWYAALGCNVIQTFAVSCNGYAWYKGGTIPPQPGLTHDFLPEVARLGHGRGMQVMGYFCVGANVRWSQEHPDLSYGIGGQTIPMTDAYLDYLGTAVEEGLTRGKIDGFMVDWLFNPPDDARRKANNGQWLPCDKELFAKLLGKPFPADGALSVEDRQSYESKAIERCWRRIHDTAKRVKPDCVIWLSNHDPLHAPGLTGTSVLKEVDWMMDEAGRPEVMRTLAPRLGAHTRQVLCLVGWGDAHDARRILSSSDAAGYGIYGFAKPGANSLPLPVAVYRGRSIAAFVGNDRNIAVLARYFTGESLEAVVRPDPDGSVMLLPQTAALHGSTPVVTEGQIGDWSNPDDWVEWTLDVGKPGRFRIELESAVAAGAGGSTFAVAIAGATNVLTSVETGTWRDYRITRVGAADLPAGRNRLVIRPSTRTPWHAVSIKAVKLVPEKGGAHD